MEKEVFISYSTKDGEIAQQVCNHLEQAGVTCWIAPRDIEPGSEYATQIVSAIKTCKILVLLASLNTNESGHVSNEVSLAFDHRKTLIPFKLQDFQFTDEYMYFLGRKHWIEAHLDMNAGLEMLTRTALSILRPEQAQPQPQPKTQPQPQPKAAPRPGTFCRQCGTNLNGGSFCPACGTSRVPRPPVQPTPKPPVQPAPKPTATEPKAPVPSFLSGKPNSAPVSMGLHQYLVFFGLWVTALFWAVVGILFMVEGMDTGNDINANAMLFSGPVLILAAVLTVLAALNLLQFKKMGPRYLEYSNICASAGISLFVILHGFSNIPNIFFTILFLGIGAGLVVLYRAYYGRRAHLFVN